MDANRRYAQHMLKHARPTGRSETLDIRISRYPDGTYMLSATDEAERRPQRALDGYEFVGDLAELIRVWELRRWKQDAA